MAQANVDVVQEMCEAFLGGDFEAALAKLHPEVEWHGTIGGIDEGRIFRGHREVVSGFVENAEAWESQTLETTKFFDAGDRVVVFWHEVARGRQSGAEVETETAVIYTVKNGTIVHVEPHMDQGEALLAAGVTE